MLLSILKYSYINTGNQSYIYSYIRSFCISIYLNDKWNIYTFLQ